MAAASTPACGRDEPTAGAARADQVEAAAREAGLDDEVVEVLRLAASAIDATYEVAYDLESTGTGADAGTITVEVRQRPPERRIDIVAADGTAQRVLTDGESTIACDDTGDGEGWSCSHLGRPDVAEALDPIAIDELTGALLASAADFTYTVEQRTLLDEQATCLVTTSTEATAELCLAADGAVLLASTPSSTVRAVRHSTEVGTDAFVPPAEPIGAPPS